MVFRIKSIQCGVIYGDINWHWEWSKITPLGRKKFMIVESPPCFTQKLLLDVIDKSFCQMLGTQNVTLPHNRHFPDRIRWGPKTNIT